MTRKRWEFAVSLKKKYEGFINPVLPILEQAKRIFRVMIHASQNALTGTPPRVIKNHFYGFIKKNLAYVMALVFERGIAFLLLPLYTYFLSPADYGIYAVLLSFIAFLTFLYGLGIENGLLKYAADSEREAVFMGTAFWSLFASGLFFSMLLLAFSRTLSLLLFRRIDYQNLVQLASGILFTDTLIRYFLYRLLGFQKTGFYFVASLIRGTLTVVANIAFLVVLKWNLPGVFLSYLFSNILVILFLVVLLKKSVFFRFDLKIFIRLFKFGYPVMFNSLFITLLNFCDRYLLQIWVSAEVAGLYSAAYRIAFVMNMVITAFGMGALPFVSHVLKENPDERLIFSKLMNYLFCICITLFLFLSLFIQDIVQIRILGYPIINERYLNAMTLIPIILLSYVLYGFSVNFSLGLYCKEKTVALAVISCFSFLINLVANLIGIPLYASWGAAAATCLGFFSMGIMLFLYSRRLFPVRYDWMKITSILGLALFVYIFSAFLSKISFSVKIILFIIFMGIQIGTLFHHSVFKRFFAGRKAAA